MSIINSVKGQKPGKYVGMQRNMNIYNGNVKVDT